MAEEKYWFNVRIASRYDVTYSVSKKVTNDYDPIGYWHIWFFGSFSEFKKYLEKDIEKNIFIPITNKHGDDLISATCNSSWLAGFNILSLSGIRYKTDDGASNLFVQMVIDAIYQTIDKVKGQVKA